MAREVFVFSIPQGGNGKTTVGNANIALITMPEGSSEAQALAAVNAAHASDTPWDDAVALTIEEEVPLFLKD